MINAFKNPNDYRTMLTNLTDEAFNELSVTVKAEWTEAIESDTVSNETFDHLFQAQSLIEDETNRRNGNNEVGFTFNPVGF